MSAPTDAVDDLGRQVLTLARDRAETVATAESLTAGLVAATLADVPGASDVLRGGVVAYATDVKTSVLGVSPSLVAAHGVVSAECAVEMAERACRLLRSSLAVATTGVAGPTEQEGKPVGTVFVAVARASGEQDRTQVRGLALTGSRQEIRRASVAAALGLLAEVLAAL
jgi:nicotinamide-nucleotide amidase